MAAISSREVAQEQRGLASREGAGTLARPPGNSVSGGNLGQLACFGSVVPVPWNFFQCFCKWNDDLETGNGRQ